LKRTRLLFAVLAVLLIAGRLCHLHILWEGDTLPLAAATQMAHGKVLYRDVWFDKPPLVPAFYLLSGARAGWPLRLEDALYALLACWIAYRFARDLWSEHEGQWAAGLLGFFLLFDFPSAIIPVASDLMMLAPHLAAVWLAYRRRPFYSGLLAGIAFWISPKGALVALACVFWDPAGWAWIAAGFAAAAAGAVAWLGAAGALAAYWEEVWVWGRLYAASPFVASPVGNAALRTVNWAGFHIAAVLAAGRFLVNRSTRMSERLPWLAWLVFSFAGLAAGMRFFPRYYFQVLPVVVLMAARGFTLMAGRRREIVALLLLIPATRFGPSYLTALTDPAWRDILMDRDSRTAAAFLRDRSTPGDTLFIWGYRPEIFVYSRIPAATRYLDSQPLTGVPADRHLTQSEPVEPEQAARRRLELPQSTPTFILDGIGPYNPQLAITAYPELRGWLAHYTELGRVGQTIVYRRTASP
jgi:hypothetical protein